MVNTKAESESKSIAIQPITNKALTFPLLLNYEFFTQNAIYV